MRSLESEKLQDLIWQQAVTAADKDRGSLADRPVRAKSLNEMIDVHAKRMPHRLARSRRSRSRFGSACSRFPALGIGRWVGIRPVCRTTRFARQRWLVVAFAGVLFLIVDLDRGREGFLTVKTKPP